MLVYGRDIGRIYIVILFGYEKTKIIAVESPKEIPFGIDTKMNTVMKFKTLFLAFFVIFTAACCKKINKNKIKEDLSIPIIKPVSTDLNSLEKKNSLLKINLYIQEKRTLEEYKFNFDKAKVFYEELSVNNIDVLEALIPQNSLEFIHFYSLSYPETGDIQLFNKLNLLFFEAALNDMGKFLKLFSNLAEFVDGEYAESFFDEIDLIIERNTTGFCKIFKNLSRKSKLRLIEKEIFYCEK